jgi:N-methylhydantoinase A
MSWTIGIDIGGTFTDCVCASESEIAWGKAPSSLPDPAVGVMAALEQASRRAGYEVRDVLADTEAIVHGCTIGTNAVIERKGSRVALLVTSGQRDVLRIGRLFQKVAGLSFAEISRTSRLHRPTPLVDHGLTFELTERLDRDGDVLVPLRAEDVEAVVEQIRPLGVESIAICLLWSFLNPVHEQLARDVIAERLPGVEITMSSGIAPILGEYERTVAAVLNAYVSPSLRSYLEPLESQLADHGLRTRLQVFHSGGGVTSVRGALAAGIRTLDSGPVGGVVGAQALGAHTGSPNLICADMGGTSLDVATVWAGRLEEQAQPTIDQYTYSVPRVAVSSIGAGGGSIAWVDEAGLLRVGPMSAGATPGPACYGGGGVRPTVTDANVILGQLSREALLAGEMPIDHAAAFRAFEPLAEALGASVEDVARAVIRVVNAQMADLVRRVTLERGFDPRDFALVVYGGAGPAHGVAIGLEVGCGRVIFPDNASVFAASGMGACDTLYAAERTVRLRSPFARGDTAAIESATAELREAVRAEFRGDGQPEDRIRFHAQAGMRYQGQVSELPVQLGGDEAVDADRLVDGFLALYGRTYGSGAVVDGVPIELARLRVEGRIPRGPGAPAAGAARGEIPRPGRTRFVMFPDEQVGSEVPVLDVHGSMRPNAGARLLGPLIIERYGETIVIPRDLEVRVIADGSLVVELEGV